MLFGREPRLPPDKLYYDKNAKEPTFKDGEKVWEHNKERKQGLSPKLQTQWQGPYQVIKKISPVNFKVQLVDGSKPHFIVHSNRLKKFHEPPIKPNDNTEASDSKDNASDNTLKQNRIQDYRPPEIEKARTSEIKVKRQESKSDRKIPNNLTNPKPSRKKSKQSETSFTDETPLITDQGITDDNDNDIFLVEAIRNHREGINEETIQLDNGLVLRNTEIYPNTFHPLTEIREELQKQLGLPQHLVLGYISDENKQITFTYEKAHKSIKLFTHAKCWMTMSPPFSET